MIKQLLFLSIFFTVHAAMAQAPAQAWIQRYTWPTINGYGGFLLKVDSNNNLIVVGNANGPGDPDIAVIKYSNSGVPLWTNYFTGAVSGSDYPVCLAVDGSNNVILGGFTWKNGSGYNTAYSYFTIEYSSTGIPLWTNYFSASVNSDDRLQSMTVDSGNYVIVTGTSEQSFNYVFTTIRYSSMGMPLWTNVYSSAVHQWNSAYSVVVDTNKNIYVWGSNPDGVFVNYALIKYSSDGVALWTNITSTSVDSYSVGSIRNDLAVDSANNIIATGQSGNYLHYQIFINKYSNDGAQLWTQSYDNNSYQETMILDKNDNPILFAGYGSYTNNTALLLKYSSAGAVLWTNLINGSFYFNFSVPVLPVVDNGNNVIIAGSFTNSSNGYDFLTLKYTSAGVLVWTNTYNGPVNGNDQASAVALDSAGNVFVTGSSWNGTNNDITTIKYQVSQSPIPLYLQKQNNQMVLSWSNAAFSLQSAPTITGNFTNVPGATSPYTNPIIGTQKYFRLISN